MMTDEQTACLVPIFILLLALWAAGLLFWETMAGSEYIDKRFFRNKLNGWAHSKLGRFGWHWLLIPVAPLYFFAKRKEIINFREE